MGMKGVSSRGSKPNVQSFVNNLSLSDTLAQLVGATVGNMLADNLMHFVGTQFNSHKIRHIKSTLLALH
jgi:hypothetical protein